MSIKYDVDEFVIKCTPEKVQVELQTSSFFAHIHSTEIMVRKNNNDGDKNKEFYSLSQISEPITTAVNIPSTFSSEDVADPN